eukprot:8822381-Alexandrium_andersonii.AAC.1
MAQGAQLKGDTLLAFGNLGGPSIMLGSSFGSVGNHCRGPRGPEPTLPSCDPRGCKAALVAKRPKVERDHT